MPGTETVTATEFQASLRNILDRIASRKLGRVEITERDRVIGVLTQSEPENASIDRVYGFMRGSVAIPEGFVRDYLARQWRPAAASRDHIELGSRPDRRHLHLPDLRLGNRLAQQAEAWPRGGPEVSA